MPEELWIVAPRSAADHPAAAIDRCSRVAIAGIVFKTRLNRIWTGWSEQKAIRAIMLFLQSHGIGTARSVRIFKAYGADAVPLVTKNPYPLAREAFPASGSTPPTSLLRSSVFPRPRCYVAGLFWARREDPPAGRASFWWALTYGLRAISCPSPQTDCRWRTVE